MKKIPKKKSFKTPEGYFEGVTDRILDRIKDDPSLSLPEADGFKVPDGYFDQVPGEIVSKLDDSETPVIQLKSYRKYFYVAASIAAIFVIVIGLQWNKSQNLSFEDLASADITSYFETQELGLSSYEIAEVLPVDDIKMNDFMETDVDDENIMEYLEGSIDDLDELNIDFNEEYQ